MKPNLTAIYIILLISALFFTFEMKPATGATIITHNPTANYGSPNWFFPQNAYVSDDNYTSCSRTGHYRHYHDYGFDVVLNSSCIIDMVEVGVEHYETGGTQRILVAVSVDGGTVYTDEARLYSYPETLEWVDFTDATPPIDWSYDLLYDTNLRARVRYSVSGGCYANNTFLVVYNPKSKAYSLESAGNIALGDSVLAWNSEKGVHVTTVNNVTAHYGKWVMLDFFSGNVTFNTLSDSVTWDKHLAVTSEHPMYDVDTNIRRSAKDFTTNDVFTHLDKGRLVELPITRIDSWNFTGLVYNIGIAENDTCIFAKSLSNSELAFLSKVRDWRSIGAFDNIMMAIKVPWTTYLDWLPVRVTYHVTVVEIECGIPCLFIGLAFFSCLVGYIIFSSKHKR